jgi:hypothetical protein
MQDIQRVGMTELDYADKPISPNIWGVREEPEDLVWNTWANSYDNAVNMKIGGSGSGRMEWSCSLAVVTNGG